MRPRLKTILNPKPRSSATKKILIASLSIIFVVFVAVLLIVLYKKPSSRKVPLETNTTKIKQEPSGPLAGYNFYIDKSREVNKQADAYRSSGDTTNAMLLEKIASQPTAIWLTGPTATDPLASNDLELVVRTSKEALSLNSVPLYQLYAIPNRDACAEFSNGGFKTEAQYLNWLKNILDSLQTKAIFGIEADSIGHTLNSNCLSQAQINERYALLNKSVNMLATSPNVIASYLDAGHSEWFPDPNKLIEPLKNAGIEKATGVAVNVSNFVATLEITNWSTQLAKLLGNKGVIIDTSRNGRGPVPGNVTGDARWCNPAGRGLGLKPRTNISEVIHAYYWGKGPGESDGSCFGNPPAGTFVPSLALELAKNAL